SSSAPRERLLPKFWRWRVISAGVVECVTLAIVSVVVIENSVSRSGPLRTPASTADSRSGPSWSLANVSTLPTRKLRMSSLRGGDGPVRAAGEGEPLHRRARGSRRHVLLNGQSRRLAVRGDGGEGLVVVLIAGVGAEREHGQIGAEGELADGRVVGLQRRAVVA